LENSIYISAKSQQHHWHVGSCDEVLPGDIEVEEELGDEEM
jgi:protein tyrosine/serine phosphatase